MTNPFQICWLCLRLTSSPTCWEGLLTLRGVALTTHLPRKGSQVGATEDSCSINNYCPVWNYFFPDNWAPQRTSNTYSKLLGLKSPQRTSNTCIKLLRLCCYKIPISYLYPISVSNSPKLRGTMARLRFQSSTPTSQELSCTIFQSLSVGPSGISDTGPTTNPVQMPNYLCWLSTTKHQLAPPCNDQYHLILHSWANWSCFQQYLDYGFWLFLAAKFNQNENKRKFFSFAYPWNNNWNTGVRSSSWIYGINFFIPFPFSNLGYGCFHFLPLPEFREWNNPFLFQFPNSRKSFVLTLAWTV